MDRMAENYDYLAKLVASKGGNSTKDVLEDITQEVCTAVVALERGEKYSRFAPYDPDMGTEWLTYMHTVALGVMADYYSTHQGGVIDVPRRVAENMQDVDRATGVLQQRLGREPTLSEVAEAMGITRQVLENRRTRADIYGHLAEDIYADSDDEYEGVEFEAMIPADELSGPMELLIAAEELAANVMKASDALVPENTGLIIKDFLAALRPDEAAVLVQMYGIDGEGQRTMREIATNLGHRSPTTVMNLRDVAIRKLKHRGLGDALVRELALLAGEEV